MAKKIERVRRDAETNEKKKIERVRRDDANGNGVSVVFIEYKGEKSKKGNYFPYLLKNNALGIVGQVYFPVKMAGSIPKRIILEIGNKAE